MSQPEMQSGGIDLREDAFLYDPYPYYARLRNLAGPYWLPHQGEAGTEGLWLFSRYSEASVIFRDSHSISKNIQRLRAPGTSTPFDANMLLRDGADHLRLRRLLAEHFSVAAVASLEPQMASVASELVRELQSKREVDLVADFAEKLPMRMVMEFMGIPVFEHGQLRSWSLDLIDGFDSILRRSPEVQKKQATASVGLLQFTREVLVRESDIRPGSVVATLLSATKAGVISHDELMGMMMFLLVAGHETTTSLLSSSAWLLLSNPSQLQLLLEDPGLVPSAVEEVLRYESPEQRTTFRVTTEPYQVGNHWLEPGEQIGVIINAANRDYAEFANADVFDIKRQPNRHLAFGIGLHHCQGKIMARTEARIGLAAILPLLPGMRLSAQAPMWRPNSFFRGLRELRVSVH